MYAKILFINLNCVSCNQKVQIINSGIKYDYYKNKKHLNINIRKLKIKSSKTKFYNLHFGTIYRYTMQKSGTDYKALKQSR